MRSKLLWLFPLLCLFSQLNTVQAQTYLTQPLTAQNAPELVPLIAFDHNVPLDDPYPVTPTPTSYYSRSERVFSDPHFIFSPDERYLAHIVDEPLVLWLVDLVEGTERAFPLAGINLSISPDWRTLAVMEPGEASFSVRTRLWDMEALLALPRAPIGETGNGVCQFRITIGSTNLRQSPSVQAASMGYALADQTYTVIATTLTGDWVQVRGETQPVWIGSQYGTFEGNCIAPPARLLAGGERAVLNNRLLEFSPDSQFIVTGNRSNYSPLNTIQVYDTKSGEFLYELSHIVGYSFSPDSRLLVDGAGQFFELATGNRLFSMVNEVRPYSTPPTYTRAFNSDGSKVALVGSDGIVRLLDTETGEELRTFTIAGEGGELLFSPNDQYLYIMAHSPSSRIPWPRFTFLWDLTTSLTNVLPTRDRDGYIAMPTYIGNALGDTFLPDGSSVLRITYDPDSIGVWDITTRDFRFLHEIPAGVHYRWTRLTPTDNTIMFAESTGRNEQVLKFLSLNGEPLSATAPILFLKEFSPEWRWIVTEDERSAVTLWGVPATANVPTVAPTVTRTPTPTLRPGTLPTQYPTDEPFDNYAIFAPMTAQALTMTSTPTPTFTPSATQLPTMTPFVVTPQPGAEAITAANYEQVSLLQTIQPVSEGRAFRNFAELTPDGSWLVTAGNTSLKVWDVVSGEPVMEIDEHPTFIIGMDVSRDGQYVLTLADDSMLRLWSLSNGALINSVQLEGRTLSNIGIHLSPDNRRALVSEYNAETRNHLRVRELETGTITLDQSTSNVISAGFRSDGIPVWWTVDPPSVGIASNRRTVVYSSSYIWPPMYELWEALTVVPSANLTRFAAFDNQNVNIRIWDTAGGRDPLLLQGHTSPVREAYFSPDGRLLVSFGSNGEMMMWDATSGEILTTIPEGMLPNGMNIGSGRWLLRAEDGTPLIWNLSTSLTPLVVNLGSNLSMGADGATIMASNGGVVLLFGVPTPQRPAFASIPGRVVPSAINVRTQPDLDVEVSGTVEQGVVVVAGRDASGQFIYLPNANGWVLADPAYIDLGGIPVEALPIRNA